MNSGIYSTSNSHSLHRRSWNRISRDRANSSPVEVVEIYFTPLQRRILQQQMFPLTGSRSACFKARCNPLRPHYRR
ncbi:MAG: hypothetical protein ACP5D7_19335 [Limnospira sp.]